MEPATISNFQCRIHCPEWKVVSSCYRESDKYDWLFKAASSSAVQTFECGFSKQSTLTFLHPYFAVRKLKYSRIDRNPFTNFNSLQLLRLLLNRSVKAGIHEGACPRSTLLQHAPGAKLLRLHQRFLAKKCCATKLLLPSFAPSYQTGLIWGSTLQGQICCTSLF